ncbi:MAG: hypothetical protein QM692_24430 [Thermomicrobiales bacterium]
MRQRMVVLDVTQMRGNKVCVGGYLTDGEPIRPICFPFGPDASWLEPAPGVVISPFSVVDLHVGGKPEDLQAPHTEDRLVPPRGHRVVETLPAADCREWLEWRQAPGVAEIFGATVRRAEDQEWGRFVQRGEGARSLGTVRAAQVLSVLCGHDAQSGKRDYRMQFQDGLGAVYRLAVVDRAFRARVDAVMDAAGASAAGQRIGAELRGQEVWLRIGLARGWAQFPDRCYLQITGVYGLPR